MAIYEELNPKDALIFRIIHRDNLPWILDHGLHCGNSETTDPNYVQIGNPNLIDKRRDRRVDCVLGGTLSDYVPFYFTPFSVMFYNINTGWQGLRKHRNDEIVILVSSLHLLHEQDVPFVFTDRHAYLTAAKVFCDLDRLDQINWSILQRREFTRDPDDPVKFDQYEAEVLVHKHLPIRALHRIICYTDSVVEGLKPQLSKRHLATPIVAKPRWYF